MNTTGTQNSHSWNENSKNTKFTQCSSDQSPVAGIYSCGCKGIPESMQGCAGVNLKKIRTPRVSPTKESFDVAAISICTRPKYGCFFCSKLSRIFAQFLEGLTPRRDGRRIVGASFKKGEQISSNCSRSLCRWAVRFSIMLCFEIFRGGLVRL